MQTLRRLMLGIAIASLAAVGTAAAQQRGTEQTPASVLFVNVRVFDGKADKLSETTDVLVVGNKISKIGKNVAAPAGARNVDGARVAQTRASTCPQGGYRCPTANPARRCSPIITGAFGARSLHRVP